MSDISPPRQTSGPKPINIVGHIVAWHNGQPVMLMVDGSPDLFLPLFSDVGKIGAIIPSIEISDLVIRSIDDPSKFLASLPYSMGDQRLHVIVDPYRTPDGHVHYKEVVKHTRH